MPKILLAAQPRKTQSSLWSQLVPFGYQHIWQQTIWHGVLRLQTTWLTRIFIWHLTSLHARDAPFQLNCTKNLGGSFSQPPSFSSAMQNFGEIQDQDEPVNQLDESSGQVAQTSLGTRPLFEDKPTSKVQIVCAASYVLESLLVQELILARSTSD